MSARVVLQSASRPRWLERRRKGITATDAAALMGVSAWKTPLGVWLDKVEPIDPVDDPSYIQRRGRVMEAVLADEYEALTGHWVDRPPLLVAHPDHPLLLASLDRVVHTPQVSHPLELKTAGGDEWQEWMEDDTPDGYAVQALWQAMITGAPYTVIFADVGGRLHKRTIPRDEVWEAEVIPRMLRWWDDHVVADVPPPVDDLRDYVLLNRVWRPDPAERVTATPEVVEFAARYRHLQAHGQAVERDKRRLLTAIRVHMKTAGVLEHPDSEAVIAAISKDGKLLVKKEKVSRS